MWRLAAVLLLGWCGAALGQQPVALVLGDSISAGYGLPTGRGWVNLLAQKMEREGYRFKVVNASVSGETTLGGRNRLPPLLAQYRPTVVIVELGANDALRGSQLASVRTNLDAIVADSRAAGAKVLVLGMRIPPNYGPAYGRDFSRLFGTVAKSSKSALVPFLLEGFAQRRDLFQEDGIHPGIAAQAIMADMYSRRCGRCWAASSAEGRRATIGRLFGDDVQPLRLQMTAIIRRLAHDKAIALSTLGAPSSPTLPEGEGSMKPPSSPALPGEKGAVALPLPPGEGPRVREASRWVRQAEQCRQS